jgi:hypothetical protein
VPAALKIADNLISGNQIEILLTDSEKDLGEDVCTFIETVYENSEFGCEALQHFRIQDEYFALRDRGAAGDAEAAIAYCKLEMQGLVSHGAYG